MGLNDDHLSPSEHDDVRARLLAGTKRIKPVGAHRRAIVTTTVSVALVAVLSVGAIGAANFLRLGDQSVPVSTPTPSATTSTPTPSSTPTSTPTQTPTPTVPERVVSEPASRFAFDCVDLAEDVAPLFGGQVPVVASEMPRAEGHANWLPGPAQYAYWQAGALACEYGSEATEGGAWASVRIVADAEGILEDRAAVLGASEPCMGSSPCELLDGVYAEVIGQPAGDPNDIVARESALGEAAAAIRERLATAEVGPPSWQPPAGSTPVSGGCDAVLPASRLAEILGVTGADTFHPDGGWGADAWMISSRWGAEPCYFAETGADLWSGRSYGVLTWLPGGEWAYELGATGLDVALPGAVSTDEAVAACGVHEVTACTVDVLADGNWVRYQLPSDIPEGQRARVMSDVAAVIVETVRGT